MATHSDNDHDVRREFLRELELRAEIMEDLQRNSIQNEKSIVDWRHDGMTCQVLPDDRQGILRISVGGGRGIPVHGDYCNIRGDVGACIALLERALAALKRSPI